MHPKLTDPSVLAMLSVVTVIFSVFAFFVLQSIFPKLFWNKEEKLLFNKLKSEWWVKNSQGWFSLDYQIVDGSGLYVPDHYITDIELQDLNGKVLLKTTTDCHPLGVLCKQLTKELPRVSDSKAIQKIINS